MRILIIRHGDPDYAVDSVTERGKIEAELLAGRLANENIDYMYISPLGRAQATAAPYLSNVDVPHQTVEFLREFSYGIELPDGKKQSIPWDLLPSYYATQEMLLCKNEWFNNKPMSDSKVYDKYKNVCNQFDNLLAKHGYERDGSIYKTVNPNKDTIALVCHFGIEAVLLSHLFNCAPHILWQNTIALPSSVTTLHSEEREEGIVQFRCCGFGDCSHLYAAGVKPSHAGRFVETYDPDDDRNVDPNYKVSIE